MCYVSSNILNNKSPETDKGENAERLEGQGCKTTDTLPIQFPSPKGTEFWSLLLPYQLPSPPIHIASYLSIQTSRPLC